MREDDVEMVMRVRCEDGQWLDGEVRFKMRKGAIG